MDGAEEARIQREQLDRYLRWHEMEGGVEGPTRLSTMFSSQQVERMDWLRNRCIGRIAEVGCNWGLVLAYCRGHIGVDWNENSIALARILNPEAKFIVQDARELALDQEQVDCILLPDILEHLAFEDVNRVLVKACLQARLKVLITIPKAGTPEGNSFKHVWQLTPDRARLVQRSLSFYTCHVSETERFIMFEVVK